MALSGKVKGAAAGCAAAAVLVVATSYATAGSDTITACVHQHGGGLYEAKKCAHGDERLQWGAQGPRGARGKTGKAGPAGTIGATGAQGPSGTAGPPGTTGAQGPSGAAGPPGTTGAQGPGAAFDSLDTTGTRGFTLHTITVAGQQIVSQCGNGPFGNAGDTLEITFTHGTSLQYMHGTVDVSGSSDDAGVGWRTPTAGADYADGENMVAEQDDGTQNSAGNSIIATSSTSTPLSFQLHVLVNDPAHAYLVDVAGYLTNARCQAFTTVTPTNGDSATVTN